MFTWLKIVAFYTIHACRETLRLKGSLAATATIVIGICLPLILLWGLADGLIKQQEQDVLKSPTACQLRLYATGRTARPFTITLEKQLVVEHPDIDLVIPDITKVVEVHCDATTRRLPAMTVMCTKPGDPLLDFYQADILKEGERGMVLSRSASDLLQIRYQQIAERRLTVVPDQRINLTVTRYEEGSQQSTAEMSLQVRGIADLGTASVGYLPRQLLDWIEDYHQGKAVDDLGWPGFARTPPAAFEKYLCFSKVPLSSFDHLKLRANGLAATLLEPTNPAHQQERSLYRLLEDHQVLRLFAPCRRGRSRRRGADAASPHCRRDRTNHGCRRRDCPLVDAA